MQKFEWIVSIPSLSELDPVIHSPQTGRRAPLNMFCELTLMDSVFAFNKLTLFQTFAVLNKTNNYKLWFSKTQ